MKNVEKRHKRTKKIVLTHNVYDETKTQAMYVTYNARIL